MLIAAASAQGSSHLLLLFLEWVSAGFLSGGGVRLGWSSYSMNCFLVSLLQGPSALESGADIVLLVEVHL